MYSVLLKSMHIFTTLYVNTETEKQYSR